MEKPELVKSSIFLFCLLLSIIVFSCNKEDKVPLTLEDIDGNVYQTVTIDNTVWMTEDLKTTRYNNGDLIETTSPASLDISQESSPKYQWAYNGDEGNVGTYGRLYTWYAATDSRGLCPTGWHLSSSKEWDSLIAYTGGRRNAPTELKKIGFISPPGGTRERTGMFTAIDKSSGYWSSTTAGTEYWAYVYFIGEGIDCFDLNKQRGFSVRCVRSW